MVGKEEYDFRVRRLIPASVAAFAVIVASVFCAPVAEAQIHGVPTSVTSTGFGGHFDQPRGIRTSVTSLGPNGYTGTKQFFNEPNCCINPLFPLNPKPPQSGSHHPHRHPFPVGGSVYAVPYPVYMTEPGVDDSAADDSAEQQQADPADYGPGPTIFDRRGSDQPRFAAEAAYAERMREEQPAEPMPQSAAPAEPAPVADQPQTALVFKDGHQLEVQNYAIVGNMLYDMTPGRRSKIALADLDLTATAKENDDRGIDFQLPVLPARN